MGASINSFKDAAVYTRGKLHNYALL